MELKNTISELKKLVKSFENRLNQAEKKNKWGQDRLSEIIEEQRKNK